MSPPEGLLHRCLLLGVLAPVWGHGRKASLLTPGSVLTRPSHCGGGLFGFAPRSQWRDRAGPGTRPLAPSPPASGDIVLFAGGLFANGGQLSLPLVMLSGFAGAFI